MFLNDSFNWIINWSYLWINKMFFGVSNLYGYIYSSCLYAAKLKQYDNNGPFEWVCWKVYCLSPRFKLVAVTNLNTFQVLGLLQKLWYFLRYPRKGYFRWIPKLLGLTLASCNLFVRTANKGSHLGTCEYTRTCWSIYGDILARD